MRIGPEATLQAQERAWLAGLLSDSREVVLRLLDEPRHSVEELRAQVLAHLGHVRQAARMSTDLELAEALGQASLELLDRCTGADPNFHQLAQVAIRYFVLDDDGDGDLDSVFGFDDDAEVFNAVADRLGVPELAVEPP